MPITRFEDLPKEMQNQKVKTALEMINRKRNTLFFKRLFDLLLCIFVFLITLPFFLLFALLVKLTSKGPVFFRQERIGKNGKAFYILKFRTMVTDADKNGIPLTTSGDKRITSFGKFLRAINMDEMPQLLNVIKGDMSIIGTRPEVRRYVSQYTDEMYATLLLAPGMLSEASVKYKEEAKLLIDAKDPEKIYLNQILPDKMRYNLEYLEKLSLKEDLKIIGRSIACMFQKEEKSE